MPEYPEVNAWKHVIMTGKGYHNVNGLNKKFEQLQWFAQIVPVCLSIGTEDHPYRALTVDKSGVKIKNDAISTPTTPPDDKNSVLRLHGLERFYNWPPSPWQKTSQGQPWDYLLEAPKAVGNLICVTRGKLMVIAAGQHAVCISFGLEGHVFGMKVTDFEEIIHAEGPGPNPDLGKAEEIHTFQIPQRLIVEGSSDMPRTIKIFAAFISSDYVFVVADFSGLLRMHVKSKEDVWMESDLSVGSKDWEDLFDSFKGGPDWLLEPKDANDRLDKWRLCIMDEYQRWLKNVKAERERLGMHRVVAEWASIKNSDGSSKTGSFSFPNRGLRPIIKEICNNSKDAFSGYGRHLANDFLHEQGIFPGMPSWVICKNDESFLSFKKALSSFLVDFTSEDFYRQIATVPNSSNPFMFNDQANQLYMIKHISIFRRSEAKIKKDLYKKLCYNGLLDPEHTIDEPYSEEKGKQLFESFMRTKARATTPGEEKNFVRCNVYFYRAPLRAYSVITAKFPEHWSIPEKFEVTKDISTFGYTTTIGPSQFREFLLNRVLVHEYHSTGGRPATERTGKPGRPKKKKSSKKAAEQGTSKALGRKHFRKGIDPEEIDAEEIDKLPENDDDNAGDARDGDGSACIEDPFVEIEDLELEKAADYNFGSENNSHDRQTLETMNAMSTAADDHASVDRIMHEARYVLKQYTHETGPAWSSPYNVANLPPGILTYSRAYNLAKNEKELTFRQMRPYLTVEQRYGTTILEKLNQQGVRIADVRKLL